MGLFNFGKKEEKKEFVSKTVLSENVNEALLKVSKETGLALSSLDFNVLSYKTYIKLPNEDFKKADQKMIEDFEQYLLNPECEIKQVYEIEIIKYKPLNNFELLGSMKVNKNFTYAEFIVSKKSVLKVNDIYGKVKEELNKKKLKNSLLINFFNLMDEDIKKLQSIILINEKLNDDFTIRLCRGLDPVKSTKGEVLYHFREKKTNDNKKILLYPVMQGENLIEIILPKNGKNGRNCKGKILIEKMPLEFEIPEISYDEQTIEKRKENERIVYIAKKNGFITKDDDKFIIKDEMEIKQINIKTGDIENAQESDVKINVKENDVLKEAIADNMKVETTELYVKGNVGSNAKIKAKKLEINGQTHQKSSIIADNAFINIHKGNLKAKKVKINRLEGGIVKAENVEIDLAFGGTVYAKNIKINKMLSHNQFFASKLIIICEQKGEENLLSISPKKVLEDVNVEKLKKKMIEIEQNINLKTKEYTRLKKIYFNNKKAINEYKKIYLTNKKKNIKTSASVINKIKEFQKSIKQIESVKEQIAGLENDKKVILDNLDYLQSEIYNAKILSNTPWKNFNRILFEMIEPPVKYVYDTKGDEGKCGFKLKFNNESIYITKIKVEDDICN